MRQDYTEQDGHMSAIKTFLQAREGCTTEYSVQNQRIDGKTVSTVSREDGTRVAAVTYDELGHRSAIKSFDDVITTDHLRNLTRG